MIRSGDVVHGYRFEQPLGEGGGGVVWRAYDPRRGRDVAIKMLPERLAASRTALEQFEREARALAALDHPNIVGFEGIEEEDGERLLVMELVAGATLASQLPQAGLPLARLLELATALADALATAHEHGIVHRDLKPANVMIDPDGRPKILDFGLAAIRPVDPLVDADLATTVTLPARDSLSGTIPYMAPEQVEGKRIDQRADVFSFGVMLFEMATGVLPFRGDTPAAVLAAILHDEPDPPSALRPDLPAEFDRLIERCLEKDVQRRSHTAREIRAELEQMRGREAAPAADPGPSVAVLPFVDMSREHDQDYFCDGLCEEIIATLARLGGLRVASRTASFRFRGRNIDAAEMGRRLRVRALLGGSVRKAGGRLRVTAELVDASSGFDLWSRTFDADLADVFAIQQDIARNIAGALEVSLTHRDEERLLRAPTSDVRAYEYYLRARGFFYQYSRRGVEFALGLFRRALEIDGSYARAWAGVADCYCFFFLYVARVPENIHEAEAASRRALDLDPELAEAQASWGVASSVAGRDDEAVDAFETAIRLDPGLFEARYFYARHSFARGDAVRAATLYGEAEALRPEDYQAPLLCAQIFADLGRAEEARAAYRRGLRKAENRLRLHPDDTRARYMGANALVGLGETARGLEWARLAVETEPDEPMLLYNVGCIYSMAGAVEDALATLQRSVDRGLTQRGWFEHDSNLDACRGDPRFQALLARL